MFAPGAMEPATSMSSATSPSAPLGSLGELAPPSTETAVTRGSTMPSPLK